MTEERSRRAVHADKAAVRGGWIAADPDWVAVICCGTSDFATRSMWLAKSGNLLVSRSVVCRGMRRLLEQGGRRGEVGDLCRRDVVWQWSQRGGGSEREKSALTSVAGLGV